MEFTDKPKVKGQRLQSKSFVFGALAKEVYAQQYLKISY